MRLKSSCSNGGGVGGGDALVILCRIICVSRTPALRVAKSCRHSLADTACSLCELRSPPVAGGDTNSAETLPLVAAADRKAGVLLRSPPVAGGDTNSVGTLPLVAAGDRKAGVLFKSCAPG